jgi:hypothetical protein
MTENQKMVRAILDQYGIDPAYQPTEYMADMTIRALECENILRIEIDPDGVLNIEFYEDEPSTI